MSASVMQLHHFMFKDSNLVRSGNGTKKKSTEDKSEEGKTLLSQVQKQHAELIFRKMVIITMYLADERAHREYQGISQDLASSC